MPWCHHRVGQGLGDIGQVADVRGPGWGQDFWCAEVTRASRIGRGTEMSRTVIANFSLSLDGRVNGVGGDYDMSWIVPHAITEGARDHMVRVTGPATTALLGRKNYQGFGGFWPAVAKDENADPRDRAFAEWLNAVEKVVFSTTLTDAPWENSRLSSTVVAG